MSLTEEELTELQIEASNRLSRRIRNANRFGELKEYLTMIDMADLYPSDSTEYYDTDPGGKVLIIGGSSIKEREIYGITKTLGLDKTRIELELGYNENKTYQFNKLRYNTNYRLVLVGPLPHNTTNTNGYSSVITMLETENYYPKVIRLEDSNGLKVTKTNLSDTLIKEIESGFLKV